jgi:site-specific recombinase XerD
MTRLRKMMLEELERRNYSPRTIECYIPAVEDFARYFHRPPDQLGPEHIRQYQAYLFRQRKLAPSSVTQRLAALRFFFIRTLKRPWSVAETPYPKKVQHLPTVLSQEEVSQLINAAPNPFYRILLMTLYATGARRDELARLKVSDIDSQRMIVHIQAGKGRKDRDVMLSPVLLEALREHWRGLKPKTWLFPGSRAHTAPCPITSKVIWHACHQAALRAGLHKRVHPHTLRHYSDLRTMPGKSVLAAILGLGRLDHPA